MKNFALSFTLGLVGAISHAAVAGTITFGSYGGSTAPAGFDNTGGTTYDNTGAGAPQGTGYTTGIASAYSTVYANVLPGTSFISYDPNSGQNGDPMGTTVYTTVLAGDLAGDTGSVSVYADNTVAVYLNNVLVGRTKGPYDSLYTFSGLVFGVDNTLKFDVYNTMGPTGVDYSGTASTPEPSTLVLLGSGLASFSGTMLRKRRRRA